MRSTNSILPLVLAVVIAGCGLAASTQQDSGSSPKPSPAGDPAAAPQASAPSQAVIEAPEVKAAPMVLRRDEAALAALERYVQRQSHPDALKTAFQAYWTFREANPNQVKKPYLYFVDYGLDSREPRGWVFDMDRLQVVEGPFTVAHGRGSASGPHGIPTRFTNVQNSATTSLGLYVAEETYNFSGTASGRRYRSIGLRLRGVSGKFNSAARKRGIVVHGAPYVTPTKAGRSEGCPAMEPARAERLIPLIANGGVVFHFSPADARWMREDPWIARARERMAGAVTPDLAG